MEQRWLVQPACLLVVLLAWCCPRTREPSVRRAVVAAGLASALAMAALGALRFPRIFFVYSGALASEARQVLAQSAPGDVRPWSLAAARDHCEWTLLNGRFFEIYGPKPGELTCIDDPLAPLEPGNRVVARLAQGALQDVTQLRDQVLTRRAEPVLLDLAERFQDGRISDPRRVDTPSGMGALLQQVELPMERRSAVTVVSGFSYTFGGIRIPQAGALLRFGAAMPFDAPQPAQAQVQVVPEDGAQPIVWSALLPPRATGGPISPTTVEIDLAGLRGAQVQVRFATLSPGSDDRGHWIAFIHPRLVASTAR